MGNSLGHSLRYGSVLTGIACITQDKPDYGLAIAFSFLYLAGCLFNRIYEMANNYHNTESNSKKKTDLEEIVK